PKAGEKLNATKHEIQHSRWYNRIHKVVLSNTLKEPDISNTSILSDNITEKINEIKQHPDKEILLFGSPTATHALIQLGLIDGYWLFVNPIILGQGIPLFQDIKNKIKLKLSTSRKFTCGVIELNYLVDNS
ncbi:MAG: dihydrofolate reductase family protein, partial [Bacteroidetes bacterium]|nr:dihydrofolate reductase family protein [Bacteroidota bacterium]